MSQLEEIRERLDLCDKKIVSVLEERMDIIKEIMVYKKENGIANPSARTGKETA